MSEERPHTPADAKPFWRTAISKVEPGDIRVRGYDLLELIGERPASLDHDVLRHSYRTA